MRIGAHVPARGGLLSAIDAALSIGADAAQIFISNPRAWAPPQVTDEGAARLRSAWREAGVGPLFVHAPYVVNVASPNPDFHRRSIDLARLSVAACSAIGAAGFVVHAGSGGPDDPGAALGRAARALRAAAAEGDCPVVVELTAGTAGAVAATFAEARRLLDAAGDPRLRLCADTCHLFAAGYGLDTAGGVEACFEDLRANGLADRLVLVHANDAKHERGSRRDRHERIGEGHIGIEGFRAILTHPAARELPFVLETPSDLEGYAREIALLRTLAV